MNALTWLKEYAARSQTADALANVKKQAHASMEGTFATLIQRDQEREELATTFAGRESLERIQQEGITDRSRIESRDKALAAAAAFAEKKNAAQRSAIDDMKGMVDPAAAESFGTAMDLPDGIRGPLVQNIKTAAANKPEQIDREESSILANLRTASTPAGVKQAIELIPERLKNKPSVTTAIAIAMSDAAAKAAETADVRRKRWTVDPPVIKPDVLTDPEYLAAGREIDSLGWKIKGATENPDSAEAEELQGWKDEVAYLKKIRKAHEAKKLSGVSGAGMPDKKIALGKLLDFLKSPTPAPTPARK